MQIAKPHLRLSRVFRLLWHEFAAPDGWHQQCSLERQTNVAVTSLPPQNAATEPMNAFQTNLNHVHGGRFFLDEACTQSDRLLDDHAVFFDTPQGLVVILGCGHAGVVNTLEYIRHIANGRPVYALLGGMHLLTAGPERMAKTIETFRRLKIERIAPAHCTGISAVAQSWTCFPGRCSPCAVGTNMTFQKL